MKKFSTPRQQFDKWLYNSVGKQIGLLALLTVGAFAIIAIPIGLWFGDYVGTTDESPNVWWQLYYLFADPGSQGSAMWQSGQARVIGLVLSTVGSIFMSGILISTITNAFERRAERWRTGFSYYSHKGHIVIIGSDQMVYSLVNQLCENSTDTIVVMTSKDVEQMRNELQASLSNKRHDRRIVVNYGLRNSESYLEAINIAQAKEVYILGDTNEFDDIENFHDSLNVQCLTHIAELCKRQGRTGLPCHVLFEYKTTFHLFQYTDFSPEITDYIDFHPFNFYDLWARKVLVTGYSKGIDVHYKPLDYIPITSTDSNKFVHFIIIGMSKMGEALALQAAHIAHFPNYKRRKTKITFIDRNAACEMTQFKQGCGELFKVSRSTFIDANAWAKAEGGSEHSGVNPEEFTTHYGLADEYRHLVAEDDPDKEFIDVEWQFIEGDDHNPVVQRLLREYAEQEDAIVTVAVCLNITHESLRSAMHLPKIYYENNIPVLVQQRQTASIVSALNGKRLDSNSQKALLYSNVTPFGMIDDCYDLNMASSIEICKRIAASYEYYFSHKAVPTHLGSDYVEQTWRKMPISLWWSNIYVAASIPTKLRCIGVEWNGTTLPHFGTLTDEQVALLAEAEHNRWNTEKLLLGYRPVSAAEDKEIDANRQLKRPYKKRFIHYDIRPFDQMKEDDAGNHPKIYDELIIKLLPLFFSKE